MKTRLINQAGQQRTFVIALNNGDEVMACLKHFVEQERIEAAEFSAIGAFPFCGPWLFRLGGKELPAHPGQ
jgi:uncharacterized protein